MNDIHEISGRFLWPLIISLLLISCDNTSVSNDRPEISTIDSLGSLLEAKLVDKDRIEVFLQLAEEIGVSDSSKADFYLESAIDLSQRINDPLAESKARGQRGLMYLQLDHFDASEIVYSSLLEFSQKQDVPFAEALANYGFGRLSFKKGNEQQALSYHKKALQIRTQIADKRGLAWSYWDMGKVYHSLNAYDTALFNYRTSIDLFDEIQTLKHKALVIDEAVLSFRRQGEYDSVLWYRQLSLDINEIIKDDRRIGTLLRQIGIIHNNRGDYDKALDCYFRGLEIERRLDRPLEVTRLLNSIGLTYLNRTDNEQAMTYFEQALELNKAINYTRGLTMNLLNIGIIYEDRKEFERALENYNKALALAIERKADVHQALILSNMGFINMTLERYDSAVLLLSNSVKLYDKVSSKNNISFALRSLGMAYRLSGELNKAKRSTIRALEIAQELRSTKHTRDAARELSLIEHALGNDRKAYEAQSLYIEMKDSIENDQNTRNIARLEAEYEFSKEKRELEFTNQLQTERAEKAVKDRNVLITVGVILTIMMLVIIYLVNSNRLKQKQATEKIVKQSAELEKLNHLNTKILGVLSHDLRSPLFALQNTIALFEAERIDEEQLQERTRKLNIKLSDTSFFMDNLLRWAQDQLNELKPEIENSNLKELVEESITILKPIARDKGIELNNRCETSHYAHVDKEMAQIIIRNLVSNAIKYSKSGDAITLDSKLDEKEARLMVKDQGAGIPEGVIRELFADKGVKSTKGTNAEIGTGMGLMLAKEFASKFKGVLEVTSELRKGSTFVLRVPI